MPVFGVVVIAFVFIALCASSLLATEYYVSNSGDDDNLGTSSSQPWRTISKVNRFQFSPGDIIRFERGGVWREQLIPHSGSEEGYITYTSYGTGPKPMLLGSVERNRPKDWKKVGPNIWMTGPFPCDVGNIIFNDGETCGIKVWDESDLDRQNEFWYDQENKVIKLYSTRNPAELYDDIECALTRHIIDEGGRSYVIYDGLHLAYGAAHGIGGGNTHHIIVRNCDLCFIGGGHQYSRKTEKGWRHVRYGNGIEFWNGAHDNIVENCRIWDIYDAGLTNQGNGKNSQYNIYYRNNVIWNCEYSFEYWNRPETSTTHDIYFEGNICFNAGRGWSHSQRPWPAGVHLMFFSNTARTYDFYIRNNVFHRAEYAAMVIHPDRWNGLDDLVLNDNLYYQPSDKALVRWGEKLLASHDFDAYKRWTGKDGNSRLATPHRLILEPNRMELCVNDARRIEVTVVYSDDTSVEVTNFASYASSDHTVASVVSTGVIKALRQGKATITVTFEGLDASAFVTVTP
jgi:hypothetical protein